MVCRFVRITFLSSFINFQKKIHDLQLSRKKSRLTGKENKNITIMRKILSIGAILTLAISLVACSFTTTVTDDSPVVTKAYDLKDFHGVLAGGAVKIVYVQDSVYSVKIKASENTLEKLEVEVKDSILCVKHKEGSNHVTLFGKNAGTSGDITLYLSTPDLTEVHMAGAGKFTCDGTIDTDTLDIEVAGAADVYIKKLVCDETYASIAGAGKFRLPDVTADLLDCSIAGAGKMVVNGNIGKVKKSIAGAGKIVVNGERVTTLGARHDADDDDDDDEDDD